jgi:hypothetical protein
VGCNDPAQGSSGIDFIERFGLFALLTALGIYAHSSIDNHRGRFVKIFPG